MRIVIQFLFPPILCAFIYVQFSLADSDDL